MLCSGVASRTGAVAALAVGLVAASVFGSELAPPPYPPPMLAVLEHGMIGETSLVLVLGGGDPISLTGYGPGLHPTSSAGHVLTGPVDQTTAYTVLEDYEKGIDVLIRTGLLRTQVPGGFMVTDMAEMPVSAGSVICPLWQLYWTSDGRLLGVATHSPADPLLDIYVYRFPPDVSTLEHSSPVTPKLLKRVRVKLTESGSAAGANPFFDSARAGQQPLPAPGTNGTCPIMLGGGLIFDEVRNSLLFHIALPVAVGSFAANSTYVQRIPLDADRDDSTAFSVPGLLLAPVVATSGTAKDAGPKVMSLAAANPYPAPHVRQVQLAEAVFAPNAGPTRYLGPVANQTVAWGNGAAPGNIDKGRTYAAGVEVVNGAPYSVSTYDTSNGALIHNWAAPKNTTLYALWRPVWLQT